jgi:uncharacterized protein with NAD-binding domain and iron-sulfur cluster
MKKKVAILGGGVGGMTAAFDLTNDPDWKDRFDEITVYQLGWRLGGKGASGRNPDIANRIEEHGLHIFMGFYENAFRMLRTAYDECHDRNLTSDSPFQSYRDAFKPMNLIVQTEDILEEWESWHMEWPRSDDRPGEDGRDGHANIKLFVLRILLFIIDKLHDALHEVGPRQILLLSATSLLAESNLRAAVERPIVSAGLLLTRVSERLGLGRGAADAVSAIHQLLTGSEEEHAQRAQTEEATLSNHRDQITSLIDSGQPDEQHLRNLFEDVDGFCSRFLHAAEATLTEMNAKLRRILLVIDTARTVVRGMIRDGLLEGDFAKINDLDFLEWMQKHNPEIQGHSVLTRAFYDAAFAYKGGITTQESMDFAAGTVLYGILRLMFGYRGSILWRMQAGMGDTIFTPLYLALKERGVKFKYFHKVTNLKLSADKQRVEAIEMDVQATLKPECNGVYDPLIDVPVGTSAEGRPLVLKCWPNRPLYHQLVEAEQLQDPSLVNRDLESWWTDCKPVSKISLQSGTDFDEVVLGISIGALPFICSELIATDSTPDDTPNIAAMRKWQQMIENIKVVRTEALQLWLNRDAAEMGWVSSEPPLLSSYIEPFDTWCEMTHLIPHENWKPEQNVRQIAYFCNASPRDSAQAAFTEHGYPATQLIPLKVRAEKFLREHVRLIWSNCRFTSTGDFDDSQLVSHFHKINVDPSELYVLSVKGSGRFRLHPGGSGFENLFLAGDWTQSIIDIGCVEAAVISGRLAAGAVLRRPVRIHGKIGAVIEEVAGTN